MGAAYSNCGRIKVLYAAAFVSLGAKSQITPKKSKSPSCFRSDFRNMLTPVQAIIDGDTKIFCGLKLL